MLAQASVGPHSAIGRKESRGAHAPEDFQTRDDVGWLKHTYCWLDDGDHARLGYRPVHLQPLTNDRDHPAKGASVFDRATQAVPIYHQRPKFLFDLVETARSNGAAATAVEIRVIAVSTRSRQPLSVAG
jgi:hypothetical protein